MNYDVVRAWKDENYRESLDVEQLMANPAGELSEEDLLAVCGGDSPDDYGAAAAAAASTSNMMSSSSRHTHTWSLLCDINVFSANIAVLAIVHLVDIGACQKQICIHGA